MSKRSRLRLPAPAIHAPVVDSHCHLDSRDDGGRYVAETLEEAWQAGLLGIVVLGGQGGLEGAKEAVAIAASDPGRLRAVVGVHPHEGRILSDGGEARRILSSLRALASNPLVVAIGEVGLDFHYDLSLRDDQRSALRSQVQLAREVGLPLVVHDRESGGETMKILREEGAFLGAGVLFHCFSGGRAELDELLGLGGSISISGVVTYEKATVLREIARCVPAGRYLVETDSPWLAPEPWRGHTNRPSHVLYTVHAIAALRDESPESVAADTARSACRFFRFTLPDVQRSD
jgi:TatD DNase family protein